MKWFLSWIQQNILVQKAAIYRLSQEPLREPCHRSSIPGTPPGTCKHGYIIHISYEYEMYFLNSTYADS